jgi:hypothetical protein
MLLQTNLMIEKIELVCLALFFIKNNPNQTKSLIWVSLGGGGEIRIKLSVNSRGDTK